MFSGGSINWPREAQRGLSLNDPTQPAVPSQFYVNQLCTKTLLECTDLIARYAAERGTVPGGVRSYSAWKMLITTL